MSEPSPPFFAGLRWRNIHVGYQDAKATKEWWPIYRIAGKRLAQLGITLKKDDRYNRWIVYFTPRNAPPDVQEQVADLLREIEDELRGVSE